MPGNILEMLSKSFLMAPFKVREITVGVGRGYLNSPIVYTGGDTLYGSALELRQPEGMSRRRTNKAIMTKRKVEDER